MFDAEGHLLKDNYRPVHLKHGRIVTYRSENGEALQQQTSDQLVQLNQQSKPGNNNNNNRPGYLVFPESSNESQEVF